MNNLYISPIYKWYPETTDNPNLDFLSPLFKRRLSQLTKMTIQVLHDLIENNPDATNYKQVFFSYRGEINRQFNMNKALLVDKELLPAAFSLSVFNTPIAQASLALKLKSGYDVVYPTCGDFNSAFLMAISPILCGDEENIIFAYGDEKLPKEYIPKCTNNTQPNAFACIISKNKKENNKLFSIKNINSIEDLQRSITNE